MNEIKKLTAVTLAIGMIATGIILVPKKVDAIAAEDKVVYDSTYSIADYWAADNPTTPVKEGYVFGGWFREADSEITFHDFSSSAASGTVSDGPYRYNNGTFAITGYLADGFANKTFMGTVNFTEQASTFIGFGGLSDAWGGVRLYTKNGGLYFMSTDKYFTEVEIDLSKANVSLGKDMELKLTFEVSDQDGDEKEDDVRFWLYFNDVLYGNAPIAQGIDSAKYVGKYFGIYSNSEKSSVTVASSEYIEKLTAVTNGTTVKKCIPLTKADIDSNSDGKVDDGVTAYAKFVPAQVMSVKAQNSAGIDEDTIQNITTNPMYVRVMSSLDSANYQKVGFEIYLANWKKVYKDEEAQTPTETTKIYDGVMVSQGDESVQVPSTAHEIFGGVSRYVSVWQLTAIDTPSNASLIIYVRPYWYTMDGTKVEGLAKYVHIEDDYKNYISVPVNLLSADNVAAGAVNMTYDNVALEPATNDKGELLFEAGRIVPGMSYVHDVENRTIEMVGNGTKVNTYNSQESIYANIRFIKPSTDTNFDMELVQFCNWAEELVTVKGVWDIKYDAE